MEDYNYWKFAKIELIDLEEGMTIKLDQKEYLIKHIDREENVALLVDVDNKTVFRSITGDELADYNYKDSLTPFGPSSLKKFNFVYKGEENIKGVTHEYYEYMGDREILCSPDYIDIKIIVTKGSDVCYEFIYYYGSVQQSSGYFLSEELLRCLFRKWKEKARGKHLSMEFFEEDLYIIDAAYLPLQHSHRILVEEDYSDVLEQIDPGVIAMTFSSERVFEALDPSGKTFGKFMVLSPGALCISSGSKLKEALGKDWEKELIRTGGKSCYIKIPRYTGVVKVCKSDPDSLRTKDNLEIVGSGLVDFKIKLHK